MPTYSYLCDACGESFEKEQRITEDPIKNCLLCGKPKAHRQIVSGNFILKGGGWYSDGYGSSKSKSAQPESVAKVDKPDSGAKSESTTKSDTASTASTPSTTSTPTKTESTPKSDSSGGTKGSAAKGGSSKASAAE